MKYHRQTIFGKETGNCFSACLACLMDLEIDQIPNFNSSTWIKDSQDWLYERGYLYLEYPWSNEGMPYVPEGIDVILSGKSPRGEWLHAVICTTKFDGERISFPFVHDPHPSEEYIRDVSSMGFLVKCLGVVSKPAQ